MLSGFFGKEPPEPEPTSPLLVKNLLQGHGLTAVSGTQPLLKQPVVVTTEDAELLMERIKDPNRGCPLIYLSREFSTGAPLLPAEDLAWRLAGCAAVYVAESNWLDKKTEVLFPPEYRCWNGKLRIYLPNVRFERPGEARRHRYFTPEQVRSLGEEEVARIITRSLARRVAFQSQSPIATVDDVRLRKQERHLDQLRSQLAAAPSSEFVEVLEAINKDLESRVTAAERSNKDVLNQLEDTQLEVMDRDDQISKLRYEAAESKAAVVEERKGRESAERAIARFSSLRKLPENVPEYCDFLGTVFPSRIAFTERALTAARKASFPGQKQVWFALWEIANTLWQLVFDTGEGGIDLEGEFKNRTGLSLGMTEGRLTKANREAMRQRIDQYQGEAIDITPHIKLQTGNSYFRIYFAINRPKRLLIVGHLGDHLDTAGTSRRK